MANIAKYLKILSSLTKYVIGVMGICFVMVLCVWSIVFLNGGSVEKAQLDLQPLVNSQGSAWLWIGTLVVFLIGFVIWVIGEIRKGVMKARDNKLSAEEKARSLFWWILKH